ncbi:MAG: aminotransferase class I/II-fold pyridoxal phosphate-dependent enzyme, partial [Gemmatimonadetes bacterium]
HFLRAGALASLAGLSPAAAASVHAERRPRHTRPPRARQRPGRSGEVLLNANENPLGLGPRAREAVAAALDEANRYPRERRDALVARLAERHGVQPENIVLGNGSTEVLQMAVQALAQPRARLVVADPTFEDVPRYREPFPYRLVKVPLDFRYAHDVARMRGEAEAERRPSVVYLCNPNNPTGTLTPSAEIDDWIVDAPESVFFIVDEAYFEFVDDPGYWSAVKWIDQRPNLLVARTFSKVYGMAGMRLGYGIAHADTVARLEEFIGHNNANQLALAAALASLDDEAHVRASLDLNRRSLAVVTETLDELGLGYLPSSTNFVMHQIGRADLGEYIARFREQGIRVGRPFPPMLGYNRLSLGMPDDMARWAETLRAFRARGWV